MCTMETHAFSQAPSYEFEWSDDEPVSVATVRAIAAVSGEDPTEMEPLYTVIDPEALNVMFAPTRASTVRTAGVVEFDFAGYRVRLIATGEGQLFEQS